jgi:UDP-N-acetylmuramoyl-tripeptide--D-alanyl-D-alanine ligase
MGANHPGEIEFLCNIARPDFGLITNIGKAHLEGFGSIEGVMKTKGELYDHLSENAGTIFANKDNSYLMKILPEDTETVFYGVNSSDVLVHGEVSGKEFFLKLKWQNTFTGKEYELTTNLIGDYNLENALAAITAGTYFDVDVEKMNDAISAYTPSNNRSQYIKTENNEILLDAYNANPSSMQKALDNFSNIEGENKVLILGGMKELGQDSEKEHLDLVKRVKELNAEKIYLIGPEFKEHLNQIPEAVHFNSVDDLIGDLKKHPLKNHKILVKGSRSNKLEKVISYL